MKRILWASVLLAMAAIIMPMLFMREQVGALSADEPSPSPSAAPSSAPSPTGNTLVGTPDGDFRFTVLEGETVETVTMADYLPYVLAAEVPVSFAGEALKAQAVAARTYIAYCTEHANPKHPEANLCTEAGCCMAHSDETVLRGAWGEKFDEYFAIISTAVTETDGQVLSYDGEPILASFHSSSAGKTEDGAELWGDVPYLVSVKSPETENDVPDYVTTVEVTTENLRETILLLKPDAAFNGEPASWVGEADLDASGRVRAITVGGSLLTGSEMRKLFSLRSTAFTLEYRDGIFVFTVTGYGHGLGMSQYGANVMAKNGFGYREILEHYYPETKLG
jgi:stage II sporulation protein D